MSGQNWSIVIAPPATAGGAASYTPDLMGMRPGDPLQAGNADIISWNNRTPDSHQPVALDAKTGKPLSEADAKAQGLYLSDVIPPYRSSTPGYVTAASTEGTITINYICTFHPSTERGTIVVWNT